ncbi:branched-chain amino acid ABC transporter permease [Calderihabitans maritimus]|uniref:branched-chain amino acid ABC transporter permease n=1 Tax=Calderihabitans maritimus TaxID=1246530 RepID=UPI00192CFFE5|nr:branched-chain amino acid ABC transporter permease [Calderihabitans maritimus]
MEGLTTEIVIQTLVSGLLWGCIYALIAIGLTIIFGVMDIVNFAHGEFLMVSMFIVYSLSLLGINPLISLPVAAIALFALGILSYKTLIRRVLDAPMLAQIFVTFGLMIFLRNLAHLIYSADYRSVAVSVFQGRVEVLGIYLSTPQVIAALVAAVMTAAVYWFITKTEMGWALMAVAENKNAASLMGINSERMYALAWGIGAACVGVAGALLANFYYIFPEVGALFGLLAYVVVALGGFGSIQGAFVAGIIIGVTEALAGLLIDPSVKYVIVFSVYVVVVVLRPKGLMGNV